MQELQFELQKYFSQIKLGEDTDTVDTVLEFLWERYNSLFPEQDALVKDAEQRMTGVYESLPAKEADRLFFLISDLCIAYERAAFLNGIRIGAKLTMELCADKPLP